MLRAVHHIAIICSDYGRSKDFYTRVLGLEVLREAYRAERDSWKLDLALRG
ncbi:MAG: VOC family protein, partial [Leadbetterella sp.]|nr:VOC family protein [Leadbetterella sp.]